MVLTRSQTRSKKKGVTIQTPTVRESKKSSTRTPRKKSTRKAPTPYVRAKTKTKTSEEVSKAQVVAEPKTVPSSIDTSSSSASDTPSPSGTLSNLWEKTCQAFDFAGDKEQNSMIWAAVGCFFVIAAALACVSTLKDSQSELSFLALVIFTAALDVSVNVANVLEWGEQDFTNAVLLSETVANIAVITLFFLVTDTCVGALVACSTAVLAISVYFQLTKLDNDDELLIRLLVYVPLSVAIVATHAAVHSDARLGASAAFYFAAMSVDLSEFPDKWFPNAPFCEAMNQLLRVLCVYCLVTFRTLQVSPGDALFTSHENQLMAHVMSFFPK